MRKIDIHCHATNRPLSHTVPKFANIHAIACEMGKYDIAATLLLASYFPDPYSAGNHGTGISNFRMRDWIDRTEFWDISFFMFGSLDFNHYFYQGINELEEMAERKLIRGVKIYTGYQNILMHDLEKVIHLCSKYHLPIMFHTGSCSGRMELVGLEGHVGIKALDYFLEKYEDVTFIYTHMCNPLTFPMLSERIKRYKNLHTDMSGLIHSGKDDHEIPECIELVKKFYGECGVGQFMWGTDFPIQTHEHSVLIAEQALRGVASEVEMEQFYYGNAAKILKITS